MNAENLRIRFPNNSQHLAVVGRNGSGKTHAGLWHLSSKNFRTSSWTIIDSKGDDLVETVGTLKNVKHISLSDTPKKKGLHIVHPLPHQKAELDAFLWRIWKQGKCGVYCDEGYMLGSIPSFNALLTQGRSKRIPLIVLSQRPVWLSRFVFSEALFYQIFDLNDERDWDTIANFVPLGRLNFDPTTMAERHSLWYDVKARQCVQFSPVPPLDQIMSDFELQLADKRVLI